MTIPFDENNAPEGYVAVPDTSMNGTCEPCAFYDDHKCGMFPCGSDDRQDETSCYFRQKATD